MSSPYERRLNKRHSGSAGNASEKKTANRLKAQLQPGSGAIADAKGDMKRGEFLIEAKSTQNVTIGLKHDWLGKIAHEAQMEGKTPALTVTFTTPTGAPLRSGKWVLIPEYVFDELVGK